MISRGVAAGGVLEVRLLVQHGMETGYRLTDDGKPIPRNVIRLVTAGTLTEDSLLDAKRNNYLVAIARAKRSAAQGFMLEVAAAEQRYLLDARQYTATLGSGGLGLSVPATLSGGVYDITLAATATTFTVTAAPSAGSSQAQNDTECGTLSIDEQGTQTASGSGGVASCWQR